MEDITAALEPGAEDKGASLEIRPVSHTMQGTVEAVGEICPGDFVEGDRVEKVWEDPRNHSCFPF